MLFRSYGEAPEDDATVFGLLASNAFGDADVISGLNAVQSALMGIDLSDPAAGVTKLKEVQGAWVALAAKRFAAVPEVADETAGAAVPVEAADDAVLLEDRKSTRLNSSHITISYAVFCLKKKMNSSHITNSQDIYER